MSKTYDYYYLDSCYECDRPIYKGDHYYLLKDRCYCVDCTEQARQSSKYAPPEMDFDYLDELEEIN